MARHYLLGLVVLAVTASLWKEVSGIACLSSKTVHGQDYVSELADCSQIEECALDEVCYVEKIILESTPSVERYKAGCRRMEECKLISCSNDVTEKVPTHATHSGKRYTDEISLCTECCYNDTCNTQGCGGNALDPERVKYHKRCFFCSHITTDDTSICTNMDWCEQPTQVCAITADPVRLQYKLHCAEKKICDQVLLSSQTNGVPLLLKCFDGHLKNFNPLSNHTDASVADVLQCPTALVPTTPSTTTQAPTTSSSTTETTTPLTTIPTSTQPPPTTSTTSKTTTTTVPSTTSSTPTSTTTQPAPTPTPTSQTTTHTSTVRVTSPTLPPTTPTPVPTPTTMAPTITTTLLLPTLKTTTPPLPPTLPPLTSTSTLVPSSLDTNSPSLPPLIPTIPVATAIITMAPTASPSTKITTRTTVTQQPTTTTAPPPPSTTTQSTTTTTPKQTTTTTPTPQTTTQTTTTTTTKPTTTTQTTTTTTPKPTTTTQTTTTTTPKPTTTTQTTTTTTPKPTTTTQTTTTTTPKPTTTTQTTTPKPTTTTQTTTTPTTTPTPTTSTTTKPTTTALRTTTNAPPPAGHTIAPNPTTCFVCMDDAPDMCDILYVETTCAPPNNYCINQVTNLADGNKVVNRTCGNFDRCFKDWYHGSSDKDVCQNFDENQYITLDFECVYCCVEDYCNELMKPPENTLYEDK